MAPAELAFCLPACRFWIFGKSSDMTSITVSKGSLSTFRRLSNTSELVLTLVAKT
jgi:hypothetical protein